MIAVKIKIIKTFHLRPADFRYDFENDEFTLFLSEADLGLSER